MSKGFRREDCPAQLKLKKDATWTFAAMAVVMLFHAVSCHFMLFLAICMPCYVMLFHSMLCYFMLSLCIAIACHFMPFHATYFYVMLFHASYKYLKCWDVFNLSLNQLALMRLRANSNQFLDSRWPCLQAKPVWCQGPKIAKILEFSIENEQL